MTSIRMSVVLIAIAFPFLLLPPDVGQERPNTGALAGYRHRVVVSTDTVAPIPTTSSR